MLRKLVGYAAYMFGANTFTALLTFGVMAFGLVSRPKEAVGDFGIYMLVYEIGNGCLIYGVNATIQRYAADSDENRVRFTKLLYLMFAALMVVMVVIGVGLGYWVGWNITLGLVGIPWVATYWWGRYIVRSKIDARREARLMVVASLANSIFTFIFLTFTDLRDALIYGDFAALVASGLMALVSLPRSVGASFGTIIRTPIPKEFFKEIFTFSIPLWWAGQTFAAKVQLQAVWTAGALGTRAMGAYRALQTMWQFAGKPIEYLGQASLPGLVAAREERDILYRELLRFVLVMLPVVGICVGGGLPLVFQTIDLISELFGRTGEPLVEKYAEVPLLILIPCLAIPATAVEMVTNQYSVAVGRPRTVLYAQLVNVAVMLVALYPLATEYGLFGVIMTGAIGEAANAATFIVVLYRQNRDSMRSALIWSLYAQAFTTAAIAVVWYFHEVPFGWLATAPALALFAAGMFAVRLLQVDDFRRVRRAFGARGSAEA